MNIIINGYGITKYKRANNTLFICNIGSKPEQIIRIIAITAITKIKYSLYICFIYLKY